MRCGSAVDGEEQEVWRDGGMAWPTVESRFIAKRAKESCWTLKAGATGSGSVGGRRRDIEDGCRWLDVNPTSNMSESFVD